MSALNSVKLIGRLAKDVNVSDNGDSKIAKASIAVTRNYKNKDGNYDADFISIVAFGKQAEFLEKYFSKGDAIIVDGSIRTGSYTNKDGQKIYTTDVSVESIGFVPSSKKSDDDSSDVKEKPKKSTSKKETKAETAEEYDPDEDFMSLPAGSVGDIPW